MIGVLLFLDLHGLLDSSLSSFFLFLKFTSLACDVACVSLLHFIASSTLPFFFFSFFIEYMAEHIGEEREERMVGRNSGLGRVDGDT